MQHYLQLTTWADAFVQFLTTDQLQPFITAEADVLFLTIFISFFALSFEFLGRLQLLQSLHASFGIGEGNVSTTYLSLPLLAKLESHIITDILLGQAIAKRGKFTRSRYVKIRYAKITVGTKTCLGMSRQD